MILPVAVRLAVELLLFLLLAAAALAAFSIVALVLSSAWRVDALCLAAAILLLYPAARTR